MMTTAEVRELITDLFEEEALVIGGMVAIHGLDDEIVWCLVRNIDVIRGKILHRLEDHKAAPEAGLSPSDPKPHPAIEDFLLSLRRSRGTT